MQFGNWAASVADAMMAFGVLTDDRPRYEKGVTIYRTLVDSYFRWWVIGYCSAQQPSCRCPKAAAASRTLCLGVITAQRLLLGLACTKLAHSEAGTHRQHRPKNEHCTFSTGAETNGRRAAL